MKLKADLYIEAVEKGFDPKKTMLSCKKKDLIDFLKAFETPKPEPTQEELAANIEKLTLEKIEKNNKDRPLTKSELYIMAYKNGFTKSIMLTTRPELVEYLSAKGLYTEPVVHKGPIIYPENKADLYIKAVEAGLKTEFDKISKKEVMAYLDANNIEYEKIYKSDLSKKIYKNYILPKRMGEYAETKPYTRGRPRKYVTKSVDISLS